MDTERWDTRIFGDPVLRHGGPIIDARFVRFGTTYTREVRVGQPLLMAVVAAASIARACGAALLSVLRRGVGTGAARRRFAELKKGPEYLVTHLELRDDTGTRYEVELHGHLPQSALHRGDLVQVHARPQKDRALPDRVTHIVNMTTLQLLTPRIPTLWSHLGPALLLQAALGLTLAGAVLAATAAG
ncbi:hypothetical protein [Spirilliplanes yamanashiensis]|uniref:Uncharacterized protein n=1 Tax=Spirilliplanes yamanashiensis TaxID=42233 RepID=A0A8J4DKR2_9ACTN|nr:hypothetical protein [Spirilliplanes yamanashiensis]MDP9817763.1 hypothetical protein [Spirilliplanes yamanashiensis]GIJ04573.1 hypothetical protein Sya03_39250 [Spirilliplanes yamanashiensis]